MRKLVDLMLACAGTWALTAGGCAGGQEPVSTGFASNVVTSQTTPAGGPSGDASSEGGGSTEAGETSSGTTEPASATEPATSSTTTTSTTADPSTTSTSTTDASTTSTSTDGSTSTTSTTTTTSSTTDEPPPPKDPQPATGVFSDCFQKMCDPNLTDLCLELQDQSMKKIDGFCSLLCNSAADCQPKPQAPATTACLDIGGGDKACFLECKGVIDCPTGMSCQNVVLPNMAMGSYCW